MHPDDLIDEDDEFSLEGTMGDLCGDRKQRVNMKHSAVRKAYIRRIADRLKAGLSTSTNSKREIAEAQRIVDADRRKSDRAIAVEAAKDAALMAIWEKEAQSTRKTVAKA